MAENRAPSSSAQGGASQKKAGAATSATAKQGSPTEPGVEERVLSLPGMPELAKMPALLQDFYQRVAPVLLLPLSLRSILSAFGTIDIKAEKIAAVLRENPYYEFYFMKQIEALSKRESLPSAESAVVLLGMQKTRDLMAALQIMRQVSGNHPEWDAGGKLKVAPDQVLKYALSTEDGFLALKRDFADVGYAAALAFDLLMLAMEQTVPDPGARKRVVQFLDDSHKGAIKTAKIAVELAKGLPDFAAKRYLIPLCLSQAMGRVVLAMMDPAYPDILETASKAGLGRSILRHLEEKKFGISSATLGVAALQCMRIFKNIERAQLFLEQPFLLKARDKNLYQLSSLVLLSSNIAAQFQVPKGADDPIISQWRGTELRDFKVDGKMLLEALPRVKL